MVSQRSLRTEFATMSFLSLPQSKSVFLRSSRDPVGNGCGLSGPGLPYLIELELSEAIKLGFVHHPWPFLEHSYALEMLLQPHFINILIAQTLTDLNDFITPSQVCIKPVEQVKPKEDLNEPGGALVSDHFM